MSMGIAMLKFRFNRRQTQVGVQTSEVTRTQHMSQDKHGGVYFHNVELLIFVESQH